jgi:hypothetical protein
MNLAIIVFLCEGLDDYAIFIYIVYRYVLYYTCDKMDVYLEDVMRFVSIFEDHIFRQV